MSYRIIVDSCGELTDEMKRSGVYETASLSMQVGGVTIVDDESFDQADFLRRIARLRRNIWSCTAAMPSGYMR